MTLISKEVDEDLDLIKVTAKYGGSMKVPRRLLMMSSVWRDALDIGDLPKLRDDLEPMEKKRKLDRDFPIINFVLPVLKIVFKLLDSNFEPQDYDPRSFAEWPVTHPIHTYRDVIEASDMYDLPEIVPRFFEMLWQLASRNKQSAFIVFVVACDCKDAALARFAIQNFKDLTHPVYFSRNIARQLGIDGWRVLIRAVHGLAAGRIDRQAVAKAAKFPEDWKQSSKVWDTLGLAIEVEEEPILSAPSD